MRRAALATLTLAGALLALGVVIRAAADEWRAPSILPQRFGLRGVEAAWSDPALRSALTSSLVIGVVVALLALPIAWPAARAVATTSRTAMLVTLLALPLLVPGYAVGTGLATWLIRIGVPGGMTSIIVAHLPFVLAYEILVLAPAFDRRVRQLEEAAVVLGASGVDRLRLVAGPAVAGAVAGAVFIGFTVSLTQYGTTLVVGAGTTTLPLLLVPFAQSDPQVAATLALLATAPAIVAVALARRGRGGSTSVR